MAHALGLSVLLSCTGLLALRLDGPDGEAAARTPAPSELAALDPELAALLTQALAMEASRPSRPSRIAVRKKLEADLEAKKRRQMEDTLKVLKRSAKKVSWGETVTAAELQAQIEADLGTWLSAEPPKEAAKPIGPIEPLLEPIEYAIEPLEFWEPLQLQGLQGPHASNWLKRLPGSVSERSRESCQAQLGRLRRGLEERCKGIKIYKKMHSYQHQYGNENKTCEESVNDVLLSGREYVWAAQSPKISLFLPERTKRVIGSWGFMRQWILKLATGEAEGLLWAGFWEADTTGRASMSRLSDFAKLTDHQILHPSTQLGQVIADSGELSECKDSRTAPVVDNLWAVASMSFVLGMQTSGQSSVVALVNKRMDGARPLKDSVLARYEIPTIGMAIWGWGWSPQIILLDLQGTCNETSPFLRGRLSSSLEFAWEGRQTGYGYTLHDFATSAVPTWRCINCGTNSGCELDQHLADEVIRPLLQVKRWQDETGKKLVDAARRLDVAEVTRLLAPLASEGVRAPDVDFHANYVGAPTALYWAVLHGHEELVRLLLDKGADPNLKDDHGRTPLFYASGKLCVIVR